MRLSDVKKRLVRKASVFDIGGRPDDFDPLVSVFGCVNAALAVESWPMHLGRPMLPLLQLNLSEMPYVPEALSDVAFITLFIDRELEDGGPKNGDGWLLRAYPSTEGLGAIAAPDEFAKLRGRPLRYRLVERDFPDWDDAANLGVPDELADEWEEEFGAAEGSKLGGWPSLLQSEIFWAPYKAHYANPEFVFQLARLDKAKTAISADTMCYFGRGTGDARAVWTFASQML